MNKPPLTYRFIPAAHHHHHYLLPRLPSHQPPPLEPSAAEHSGFKPTKSVHHHPHTDIVPATQRSCLSILPLSILACRQDWTGGNPLKNKNKAKQKKQNSSAIVVLLATELKSLIFNCCTPLPRTFKLRVSRYLMSALCFSHSLTAKRRYTSLLLFFFQDIHFHLFLLSHRHLNSYNLVDPKWLSLQSCTHKTRF